MVQIGLRGFGSARKHEVEAARAFGSVLIRAEEVHEAGTRAVLEKVPPAEAYYLTVDIDGLDPAIAPGVNYPSHGGLSYYQVAQVMRGVAARGPVVGMDVVEIAPAMDLNRRTSLLAVRLILTLMGTALVKKSQR
jgi:agmatinase